MKKKCSRNWDLIIPSELLQEILSRLGLKANIQASAVCKTWREAAVSVRKWQSRPWLFHPRKGSEDGIYILSDPSRSQTYMRKIPELKDHVFCYSRDGWLLVRTYPPSNLVFLLNPFTAERIYLPDVSGFCLAFSAAPTSTSCLVISFVQLNSCLEIKTWRPGATVWTTHRFENQLPGRIWPKSVFLDGMFYLLRSDGCLGVFDPSRETLNILPVKPPAIPHLDFSRTVVQLMTEHQGDIFVMHLRCNNNNPLSVFKLNLKRNVWEEKRERGGLTIFASTSTSLTKAGLSAEERNTIYPSHDIRFTRSGSHLTIRLTYSSAWVDLPYKSQQL